MEENAVSKYRIMIIGGSAGSLEVILRIFDCLPPHVAMTIVVVIHRKSSSETTLIDLLSSKTSVSVREVEDKEPLLPDTIYIAPPDYHLLIENEHQFSLDWSEKVHHSRPSIDVTFASAAEVFKNTVIGVLLSGANADGAAGLCVIKSFDGLAIVQDPATAEVAFMPGQAVQMNCADKIIGSEELPVFLSRYF